MLFLILLYSLKKVLAKKKILFEQKIFLFEQKFLLEFDHYDEENWDGVSNWNKYWCKNNQYQSLRTKKLRTCPKSYVEL